MPATRIGKATLYTMVIVSAVAVFAGFFVYRTPSHAEPAVHRPEPLIPATLTARAWGVFDPHTGEIIAGNAVNGQYPIASVTKLFTAAAVLESSYKDDVFTITDADVAVEGRAGKLIAGTKTTPYELLFPMLLESSNDAAEAARRHLGDEFDASIARMMSGAHLENTTIDDASGLSEHNVSTVVDLARFFSYLIHTHRHALDITKLNTYVGAQTGYVNNDPAHIFAQFTGGKHGYTDAAGRTFAGMFKSAESDREFGIVLLQSDTLEADLALLIPYAESIMNDSVILSP